VDHRGAVSGRAGLAARSLALNADDEPDDTDDELEPV
jgi:hypothetical protein